MIIVNIFSDVYSIINSFLDTSRFNKLPYCNAHTPVAKHTTVADTPEARRLAENTKIQSQVKYHEEFEKTLKGKVTQVGILVYIYIYILRFITNIYSVSEDMAICCMFR